MIPDPDEIKEWEKYCLTRKYGRTKVFDIQLCEK